MKQLFSILMIVAITGMISLFYGCKGDQGVAGPAGADGKDGKDAASNCMVCHNTTDILKEKIVQYEQSVHYTGTAYVRGTSATCAPCHSSQGFRQKVAGEEVTGHTSPVPVECRTCHAIHSTYTAADFAPITTDPVPFQGDLTDGFVFDKGKGNLCVNCHQSRNRGYGLVVDGTGDVEITSSHYGPHHGTQSNTLTGVGFFKVLGSEPYVNSPHYSVVPDACVTCHMYNKNHMFGAPENTDPCVTCHGEDFDWEDEEEEIDGLMDQLAAKLVEAGLATEDEDGAIHPNNGATGTNNQVGALFNYFGLSDDGSHGAHNFKFVKALLTNSIEVFE